MNKLQEQIQALKQEKDAVILAHYYVEDEVQEIADYVGDSFYLSKIATEVPQQTICFAGVSFMGESAKILNPEKRVLLPDMTADCPMAHMAKVEDIERVRQEYDDVAVVCYINSTTELKAHSDVCVTSANAMKIVKKLPNKNIFFIPDRHLGSYIAAKVPDKHFIFNDGFCPVHQKFDVENIKAAKAAHPEAKLLVHPECPKEVVELADFIGSTSEIITYAGKDESQSFLIGTESGVMYELRERYPEKTFYEIISGQCCMDMKKVTLEKVKDCLEQGSGEVKLEEAVRQSSVNALDRMLELAK